MKAASLHPCRLIAAIGAALAIITAPAGARPLPPTPEIVTEARIVEVIDGDTVVLDTGAELRLTGIQAPKLALGRPGFRPWPLADKAKEAMRALSLGHRVTLAYRGRRIDRWKRLLAQARIGDLWLQHEMLRRGLARVYTFRDNRADAERLYNAEREARAARRGIWALEWYRILAPADTPRHIGRFQIVEGVPKTVAVVRDRAYLNYGEDWRTDFTISVAPRDMKLFRRAGIDIRRYAGRRLRVRGWIIRQNGAMIGVTHPEQIEVLER